MSYRRKSYTYEDGDAIFPIPFDYIEQDDILVFINDEQTTDFVIENTQVKLNNKPIETPAIIKIVSVTDIDKAAVEWENVSSLDEDNLILSDNQIRYAVQELYDNTEQFKVDINNTLSEVNEAARLISTTIEAVDNAVTTTQEQANIATEQANIATQQSELVASTANKALEDIDTLRTNSINELDTIVEDSVETVSGLANEITNNAQNIINRLGINLFDTKVSDHVLEGEEALGWALQGTYVYKEGVAGSRTGYADFYNRCLEEKESSTAIETALGDSTITMYVNANGHKFYDIADKTVVDTFYNAMGSAWFYGVDLANERIFLPRNDWFEQVTGNVSEVGNSISAGLPNITATVAVNNSVTDRLSGAFKRESNLSGANGLAHAQNTNGNLVFDASESNSIYGNSDTVQPNAVKKLLYICVGNTKVESAITDVTEITTSENDTLPLFHNFYSKEDMTTTGAYVNASLGSWLSGNIYKTAYNELVKKLGTDNVKSITDEYTDYDFVVNQDEMTFRLPLLNGDENVIGENSAVVDLGTPATKTYIEITQNGVLYAYGTSSGSNQHLGFTIYDGVSGKTMDGIRISSSASSQALVITKEVFKGQRAQIIYTIGTLSQYRFTPYVGNGNLYYKVANAVTNLDLLDVGEVTSVLDTCYKRNDGDNSDLSGLGMPSNKYVELTVGASGSTYTAPANGYFNVYGLANGGQGWIYLQNNNKGTTCQPSNSNQNGVNGFIPVSKGDVVYMQYVNITWSAFRFYYAQGSESEAL